MAFADRGDGRGAVEGLFMACGLVLCSWSLFIGDVFANSAGKLTLGGVVNLAYPILDAVALATVLFVALRRRLPPPGLGLLALGIAMISVGDSCWWYLTETEATVSSVTPIETGWVAGFLLIALAALARYKPRGTRRSRILERDFAPALPSLPAMLGTLSAASTTSHR